MDARALLRNGIIDRNPGFVQLLGLCPLLAMSNSVANALGLGLATLAVLLASNAVASLAGPYLPREVRLASRHVGWPTHEDFAVVESELPELADGQIRVRNVVMSVDPYMRGRMSAAKSYAAPYEVGEAMTGGAVGVVEESRAEGVAVGDHVLHGFGWREV